MPTTKNIVKVLFNDEEQKAINRAAKKLDLTTPNLLRVAAGRFIGREIAPLALGAPKGNKNARK